MGCRSVPKKFLARTCILAEKRLLNKPLDEDLQFSRIALVVKNPHIFSSESVPVPYAADAGTSIIPSVEEAPAGQVAGLRLSPP